MVKSKKMSKTGIAVIVLAILLVLSMIMGLTGAWYTAKSDNASTASDYSFTLRNDWITLSASGSGSVSVSREINGTRSDVTVPSANAQGVIPYVVMPGDYITSSGSASFTVTNSGNVGFYYVIEKDGEAQVDSDEPAASYVAAGASAANAISVADTLELVNSDSILIGASSPYTYEVNHELTYSDHGKVATIHFGSYKIFAIQAENVGSASNAYSLIKSLNSKTTGWPTPSSGD